MILNLWQQLESWASGLVQADTGGSKTGLMGELAHSVLAAGGKVIGVELQFFYGRRFSVRRFNAADCY